MPYEIYLTHHGIKGQSWGVKHGPPYPLSSSVSTGKSIKLERKVGSTHEKALSDARKRMTKLQPKEDDYPRHVSKELLNSHPIEKLSSLKRLDGTKLLEHVRYGINHPDGDRNNSRSGRNYNCPNCATAFEMTERGYDVCARPKQNRSNVGDIAAAFKDASLSHIGALDFNSDNKATELYNKMEHGLTARARLKARKEYYAYQDKLTAGIEKDFINRVKKEPGSRGIIVVGWMNDNPDERTTAFHAFNYKNDGGTVKIIDTQSRRRELYMGYDASKQPFLEGVDPREVYVMRTDTLELSDEATKRVYSNKGKRRK